MRMYPVINVLCNWRSDISFEIARDESVTSMKITLSIIFLVEIGKQIHTFTCMGC